MRGLKRLIEHLQIRGRVTYQGRDTAPEHALPCTLYHVTGMRAKWLYCAVSLYPSADGFRRHKEKQACYIPGNRNELHS